MVLPPVTKSARSPKLPSPPSDEHGRAVATLIGDDQVGDSIAVDVSHVDRRRSLGHVIGLDRAEGGVSQSRS